MPAILPLKWKRPRFTRGYLQLRYWILLAALVVVGIVLSTWYERQISAMIATLTGGMAAAKPETSAPKLPTVVRLGSGQGAPAGAGSNLPTVIRLGPNQAPAPTGIIKLGRIEVVDSDTLRVDGNSYRLVGIDTPESGAFAKCLAEREKAARASRRLREIVGAGSLQLARVSCNCAAGTEGTQSCNYGRFCGVLTSAGRDVGQILIGEGLAKRYDCMGIHCPPKQSWCS